MNLSDECDLEDFVGRPDKISAAEISAICQEAGMHAVRKNRCARRAGGGQRERAARHASAAAGGHQQLRAWGSGWRAGRRASAGVALGAAGRPACAALTGHGLGLVLCRYMILPKDFEKGYKANVKKSDHEFEFYQ
jgi:SpoVK/Ycf46/Vps4 family AAA+-type ATPase